MTWPTSWNKARDQQKLKGAGFMAPASVDSGQQLNTALKREQQQCSPTSSSSTGDTTGALTGVPGQLLLKLVAEETSANAERGDASNTTSVSTSGMMDLSLQALKTVDSNEQQTLSSAPTAGVLQSPVVADHEITDFESGCSFRSTQYSVAGFMVSPSTSCRQFMADGTEQRQTAQATQPCVVASHDVITDARSDSSIRSIEKCSVADVMEPANVDSGQQFYTAVMREPQQRPTTPIGKTHDVFAPTPTNVAQLYSKITDSDAAVYSSPATHVRSLVGPVPAESEVVLPGVTETAIPAEQFYYDTEQEVWQRIVVAP